MLNGAATLERSLRSTLGQSHPPAELVVIDGGSSDGSAELAHRVFAEFERAGSRCRMRVLRQHGRGIAGAWNQAIDAIEAEIVFLVNADDQIEPGAAERVAAEFAADPAAGIVHGNARFVRADGREIGIVRPGFAARLGTRCRTMHTSTFVRRDVYRRLGAFDSTYQTSLDYDFIERCHRAGERFVYLDATLSTFALGGVSNTRVTRADWEKVLIGLDHSRTKVLPVAAFLFRRCLMRPFKLMGYELWSRRSSPAQSAGKAGD